MKPTRFSFLAPGRLTPSLTLCFPFLLASCQQAARFEKSLLPGDIVFQDSGSGQCAAIKIATNSPWSHCGIVLPKDGSLQVLEAVQPVCWTPVREWKRRGREGKISVVRLTQQTKLTPQVIDKMLGEGESMVGRNYDALFRWDDKEIYCSELVWKVYHRAANLELCPTRPMSSYRLADPEVHALMQARYGTLPPLSEPMVSPEDLRTSAAVTEVAFPKKKRFLLQ